MKRKFSKAQVSLFRQWFDVVQHSSPTYLTVDDYQLAANLYKALGMRVPKSISKEVKKVKKVKKAGKAPMGDNTVVEQTYVPELQDFGGTLAQLRDIVAGLIAKHGANAYISVDAGANNATFIVLRPVA